MIAPRIVAASGASALAALVLVGCAAERVTGIKTVAASAAAAAPQEGAATACRFSVKSIDDHRDQASLGTVGFTRVDGADFSRWFADGMAAMPGYSREAAPLELRMEVLKAYIHSLGTLKSANIVVKVTAASDGVQHSTRTYRGVDGSLNWSSSESEIQAAFDRALGNLRQQMSAELAALCMRPAG